MPESKDGEAALFLCLKIQLVGFSDQLNFSPTESLRSSGLLPIQKTIVK